MSSRYDLFFGKGQDPGSEVGLRLLELLLAVVGITVGAYLTIPVPGAAVPQSLQTLAVLLAGAFLGPLWGGGAVLLYLAAGAIGLPVFADGASGAEHLMGPTAGYLLGFLVAATGVGLVAANTGVRRLGPALGAFLLAHAVILALGWMRLGMEVGFGPALTSGVLPFIAGAVAKSAVAAMIVVTEPLVRGTSERSSLDR